MRVSRRCRRKGGAVVEMALVLPMFVTLLLGQIESSRLGMVAQLLTTAAREGCRVAVVSGKKPTQANVQARVDEVLRGTGISVGTVTPTVPAGTVGTWQTAPTGTAVTIRLSVPYGQVSWLPQPFFLKNVNVSASATLSKE